MSFFLNNITKENEFTLITRDEFFVDKTKLISEFNKKIRVSKRFICITRPRRFGKSINALMLASYYAKHLDTKDIFDKLAVSKCDSYEKHLNKHNVIFMSLNDKNKNFTNYEDYKAYFKNGLINDVTSSPTYSSNFFHKILAVEVGASFCITHANSRFSLDNPI